MAQAPEATEWTSDSENLSPERRRDYTAGSINGPWVFQISRTMMRKWFCLAGCLVVGASFEANAQPKKTEKNVEPRVTVMMPLGLQPGVKTKLAIRGSKLDGATEIRFAEGAGEAKILSQGKVEAPDKNPDKFGGTQILAEVTLSDKLTGPATFTIVTPSGETKPHSALVDPTRPIVNEIEPNDGFHKPQSVDKLPIAIHGAIAAPFDVDVFALQGKKGQTLRLEMQAARHGSALMPHVTLFRPGSIALDVQPKGVGGDVTLEYELPADDRYFIVVSDALDAGGPVHVYRLLLEWK